MFIAEAPIFVDDATAGELLPPSDVLSIIKHAFLDPVAAPQRIAAECQQGGTTIRTLLVMPALRSGGLAVVKVVTALRGETSGLSSHLMAFDQSGGLTAVMEAHQITARRTAAASVLAAQALGAGGARRLAVLGAGRQARAQIEAFSSAMALESITIWARRGGAAENLAAMCVDKAGMVRVASTPAEAVRQAEIVSCVTASETPLVMGADLSPGTHMDLVGGFRPTMREADDALMRRSTIVADTPAALTEAGDLVQPLASGVISRDDIVLLTDVLAGHPFKRRGDVTVFKSVGHAAEDLVVAELMLRRLVLVRHQEKGGS